nr:ATP synthase F0 subunit 6 [Isocladus armatus]
MMTNLFSIFDPASSVMSVSLNWISALAGLGFLPFYFWTVPSRYLTIFNQIENALSKEMTLLLGAKNKATVMVFIALFLFILMNNSLGLLPYVFTASSHLVFTLSLALPLWLGYFAYGWVKNTTHMLAHLVPQGTPGGLMFFMVIIESISSVIRPGTLAVRLAANMIAGHLLLALMSGAISVFAPASALMIVLSQIALLALESAVAAIQAYVFAVLSTLYASEV